MPSRAGDHGAEVFPGMGHAIVVGALIGAGSAQLLARALGLDAAGGLTLAGLLAGLLGGICVALWWAVPVSADRTTARDLWDPWLDGQDLRRVEEPEPTPPLEEPVEETAAGLSHWRARVRPRVISPESGESLPLEDLIGPILTRGESGNIRIVGGAGAGKTTALNHLAGLVPPHLNASFRDEPSAEAISDALAPGWVVHTADTSAGDATNLRLAPWGKDEWIEYLLATDRRLCGSVMARLAPLEDEVHALEGIPELWRVVLDRMVADSSLPGPRRALIHQLADLTPDAESRERIESRCFAAIVGRDRKAIRRMEAIRRDGPDEPLLRLVRHRPVQLILAADSIVRALKGRTESVVLRATLPRDLVRETAGRIAHDSDVVHRLRFLITNAVRPLHPMAASLLHSLGTGWKPEQPIPYLARAYLDHAAWPEIELAGADLQGADLDGANLRGSRLDSANLEGATLRDAKLCGSSVTAASFDKADLNGAGLERARAERSRFRSACLVAANMEYGIFDRSSFEGADLSDARLTGASLAGADFRAAKLERAVFSRADLSEAILTGLILNGTDFAGARFAGANLRQCNLEGIDLPCANFANADLSQAFLTGSRLSGANLSGARLRGAGLAEVDWDGVDLRGADLREAAFHLGSSRSGLVGSPIACEGSRTGFYTDEWCEQDFKNPKEIRKANLCGADLRGARIDNVDFYLVDLRSAILDPKQVAHIRRCGAILESRA
jgi:uncharacterized protein YjbI with pentapeptide repeats